MNVRWKINRYFYYLIILAMVFSTLTLKIQPAYASDVIAYDMVGSASQNLVSYTNDWTGAFSSPGDGFQKYQRGASSSCSGNAVHLCKLLGITLFVALKSAGDTTNRFCSSNTSALKIFNNH
jgi:hypothetical protein